MILRRFFSRISRLAGGALLMAAGLAATAAPPAAAGTRPSDWQDQTTLNSGWEYVRGDVGGAWALLRSDERALELPEWAPVTLPHCVNARDSVDPDAPYYQGPAWYRTQLELANPFPGGRTLLHFEGAGQKTAVWIGDQRVSEHIGGYDEFVVDITDAVAAYRASPLAKLPATESRVKPGLIPIAVRCDNSRDLEMIPSDLSDFTRYGGLYRPVHLVYLPAGGLTRVHATPKRSADGSWQVALTARFDAHGASAARELTARVFDPTGKEMGAVKLPVPVGTTTLALPGIVVPEPRLWSPRAPQLYGVEMTLSGPGGVSAARERFGLREFEFVEHGPFKLNGERLLLQGTHRHEDHAGVGAALTDELMEKEMRLIKAMGANFIRLGHYQQSRRILELCDELGLLVWEEIPWCRGGIGGERYRTQAKDMLRALIDQHGNHPSVILWGLGNENDWPGDQPTFDQAPIRAFMSELNTLAHTLDPSRRTTIRRCDFCRDIVDVYSPSIWAGWYRGQYSEYTKSLEKERARVPHLLHAEWGGDSHAGRQAEDPYAKLRDIQQTGATDERGRDFMDIGGDARVSRDGDWSESYICDLIDWHLKEQEKLDWFVGSAMWVFKDFATPLRPENPVPRVNQKGAVERDLTPKESYYVYQSYWADEPMVRIYGHSWPVRWGQAGEKRAVRVYSNCDEVELWVNGVSQGVRRRSSQDFPAAGLRWNVTFAEGMNTLRAVAKQGEHTLTDETSFRYETRVWGAPDHLRLQEFPGTAGGRRVQVELLDAAGVVCLDSAAVVRFGQAGDGRLRDNLGTADGARVVQLANGRAAIELELPAGGRTVVSASVEGVLTRWLEVHAPSSAETQAAAALRAMSAAQIATEVAALDRERILRLAAAAVVTEPVTLRSATLPPFAQTLGVQPGDYLSMGDYWWPNPKTTDGLPYVRRDGESNPGNFEEHRRRLREMKDAVAALAAAYVVTGDATYANRAGEWLEVFFVSAATRMNPHLRFAQAIPGVSPGRGIGIIDTLHLAEVALAAQAIAPALGEKSATLAGVRTWFADYLHWLRTDANGREEAATKNNHSVAYWLQVAVFARYVGHQESLAEARRFYRETLLPDQLAPDGSFPRELSRTKPYGYSIFQLDDVALLTEVLSTPQENLWNFALPDGRSVARAIDFLQPYLADRAAWPFAADVAHFDSWPVRQPALLLAGYRLGRPESLALWRRLPADPENREVRRNLAVTQPVLWIRMRP